MILDLCIHNLTMLFLHYFEGLDHPQDIILLLDQYLVEPSIMKIKTIMPLVKINKNGVKI